MKVQSSVLKVEHRLKGKKERNTFFLVKKGSHQPSATV